MKKFFQTNKSLVLSGGIAIAFALIAVGGALLAASYAPSYAFNGDGSQNTPYLISNKMQLKLLQSSVNYGNKHSGQYFLQTADIDLSGENWVPIGTSTNTFNGIYDGGGYEISGMSVNQTGANKGLFGYAADAGFYNIKMQNPIIANAAGAASGAVVGYAANTKIDNCHVRGGSVRSTANQLGGIVGHLYGVSSVMNSSVSGTEIAGAQDVGGIVGYGQGLAAGNITLKNNYTTSHVRGTTTYIGGIVGYLRGGVVEQNYTTGSVSAYAGYCGGIAGFLDTALSTFTNNLSMGDVYSYYQGNSSAISGGIAGYANITGCVFTSNIVTGNLSAFSSGTAASYAAGICGLAVATTTLNCNAVLSESYKSIVPGTVSRYVARFVTVSAAANTVGSSNLYDEEIVLSRPTSGLAVAQISEYGRPKSQLTAYTYGLFNISMATDFTATWNLLPWANMGYPYLSNLPVPVFEKGSKYDPYKIQNLSELKKFRDDVNVGSNRFGGQYFEVTADINMNNEVWTPVGKDTSVMFSGNFDGLNHTLSNLFIDTTTGNKGLFGFTALAILKNVVLENPIVANRAGAQSGAFMGHCYASDIINVHVRGGSVRSTADNLGGIVGYPYATTTIKDCSVTGTEIVGVNHVGGIAGYVCGHAWGDDIKIINCYTTSNVRGTSAYVGGIAGSVQGTTIDGCYATGAISAYNSYVGGIVGYMLNTVSHVNNCMAMGNIYGVTSSTSYGGAVGGIAGHPAISGTTFTNNIFTGNVRALSVAGVWAATAGIAAMSNTATAAIVNGNVVASKTIDTWSPTNNQTTAIWGSGYTTATPTGTNNIHTCPDGILSELKGVTAAQATKVEGTKVAPEELLDVETYTTKMWPYGFDMATDGTKKWNIDPAKNGGMPYLTKLPLPAFEKGNRESDPHLINNVADLKKLQADVAAGHRFLGEYFKVTEGFELGDWTPIGSEWTKSFGGTFDGNYKTLRKLRSPAGNTTGNFGLFGYTAFATIKNVVIYDVFFNRTTGDQIGALVGYAYGGNIIENCTVTSGSITSTGANVGGLVGYAEIGNNTITKCYATIIVTGGPQVGGLVGRMGGTVISRCYATGNVRYNTTTTGNVGGLVGYIASYACTIKDSYATGDVTDSSTGTNHAYVGGLIGQISDIAVAVTNCWASGDVTAIIASNTAGYYACAGGITGASYAAATKVTYKNCVALNKRITATPGGTTSHAIASIIACTTSTSYRSGVENCLYNEEMVRTNYQHGTANLWDPLSQAVAGGDVSASRTMEELQDKATYETLGWTFDSVWYIQSAFNGGLPYLTGLLLNKETLNAMINEADAVARDNWKWTTETHGVLVDTLNAARAVADDPDADDGDVNAAMQNINNAVKGLVSSKVFLNEYYNGVLLDLGAVWDGGLSAFVIANNPYPNWSVVNAALVKVKDILAAGTYTHEQLNAARDLLESAIGLLNVDKSELGRLIVEAGLFDAETYEGEDFDALVEIRTRAERVFSDVTATAYDVQDCVLKLRVAIDRMSATIDETEIVMALLDDAVARAEVLLNMTDYFSETSLNNLQAMYDAAIDMYEDADPDFETALDNLVAAINALKVSDQTLVDLIAYVRSLNPSEYEGETFADLTQAVKDVEALLALPGLTVENVLALAATLQSAIDALLPDKSGLASLVRNAETYTAGFLSAASFNVLSVALADARDVLENPKATYEDAQDAIVAIETAIAGLVINRAPLNVIIRDAKEIIKLGLPYTAASVAKLEAAIGFAEGVYVSELALEELLGELISAASGLREAMLKMEPDNVILVDLIAEIKNQMNTQYYGKAHKDYYTSATYNALVSRLAAAEARANQTLTIQELQAEIDAVNSALNNLRLDITELLALISDANSVDKTRYSDASVGVFETALQSAKLLTAAASVKGYVAAMQGLNNALENMQYKAATLATFITRAEEAIAERSNYVRSGLDALESLLAAAKAVNHNDVAAFNAMCDAMSDALDGLVSTKILRDMYQSALLVDETEYTKNSMGSFVGAIIHAYGVINNANATEVDIATAIALLHEATEALVPVKAPGEDPTPFPTEDPNDTELPLYMTLILIGSVLMMLISFIFFIVAVVKKGKAKPQKGIRLM